METVTSEENGCAEDPLERSDQSSVFLSAFVHPERLQHFRRGSKPNRLAPLLNRESRQEDRHDPVLPERNAEFRVPGDLENKLPISAFV